MKEMLMESYNIVAAENGGYVVTNQGEQGYMHKLLYAGSLDDCLEFLRSQFTASKAPQ